LKYEAKNGEPRYGVAELTRNVVKYHSVQNILLFSLLSETLIIRIYCDMWTVSRKPMGKHVATERLIHGNQLITETENCKHLEHQDVA
jgi:hypothetical protein